MNKILVTGATGFIGSHLVEALLEKGHVVLCLVRDPNNLKWLEKLPVKIIVGDLLENNLILPEVDYVFHAAGLVKARKVDMFYKANYKGTIHLINALLKQQKTLKGFIFISTLAVNGLPTRDIIDDNNIPHPKTHYAKSKWMAENALLKHKHLIPLTIFRPTAIYGPRDRELLNYFRVIKRGIAPILNKKSILSFCYVKDLVKALTASMDKKLPSGEIFFVSDGAGYLWQDVIDISGGIIGKTPLKIKVPHVFAYLIASITKMYSFFSRNSLLFTFDKLKEVFQKTWLCDISKTRKMLDFDPEYNLAEGLKITLRWYSEYGWI